MLLRHNRNAIKGKQLDSRLQNQRQHRAWEKKVSCLLQKSILYIYILGCIAFTGYCDLRSKIMLLIATDV